LIVFRTASAASFEIDTHHRDPGVSRYTSHSLAWLLLASLAVCSSGKVRCAIIRAPHRPIEASQARTDPVCKAGDAVGARAHLKAAAYSVYVQKFLTLLAKNI
jgi:hypothetical protein